MKKINYILAGIILFGAVIRLWSISGPDMLVDDALYAFRSVGYVDYVAAINVQSTPATWFEKPQWWQGLSFHDAPPFVFIVQRIFMAIGGDTIWASRLPFVLAGLISIFFIYLVGKRFGGISMGLIAAGMLAVMNYAVWISRIGLLDGFVVLWIIVSLYFFLRAEKKPSHYIWWGISCGLGILSKYTFLFMGPVYLIFLIFYRRGAWRQKYFYIGLLCILLLIAPLLIYNTMMWQTRGHPDAALSTLFGMKPEDFKGLWSRETSLDLNIFRTGFDIIHSHTSAGFQLIITFSLLFLLYRTIKNKEERPFHILLWSGLLFALFLLSAIGGSERYGVILLPFFALISAFTIVWAWNKMPKRFHIVLAGAGVILVAWEIFFTIQSQLAPKPFIENPLLVSSPYTHPKWAGYNELDEYVEKFYEKYPEPSPVVTFGEAPQLANYQFKLIEKQYDEYGRQKSLQTHLLIYDDRMDWTAAYWIFERRRLYDVRAIHSITSFLNTIRTHTTKYYTNFGFKDAFFIITTDLTKNDNPSVDEDAGRLGDEITAKIKPLDEIKRYDGQVVFRVYQLPLDL